MKPPPRPRLVPARFAEAPAGRPRAAAWSLREKRSLLAALRAQAALGLPELQARPLRESLPRRSEAEILGLVSRLRGRAAREAVGTQHRACLEEQRRCRARRPAPIEVWLELAQTLAEGMEEAAAAAFSQALTIAGTEPRSRQPGGWGWILGGSTASWPGWRGGDAPELPPGEAAVLLALLASLPLPWGPCPAPPSSTTCEPPTVPSPPPGGGTGGPQGQDPPRLPPPGGRWGYAPSTSSWCPCGCWRPPPPPPWRGNKGPALTPKRTLPIIVPSPYPSPFSCPHYHPPF
ncbi:snRNA-activating protein complex subunit 2-like [Anser cygnoides]|uniref:snRNA-activating protein complex subunit 2-like n=1 Tax=Anser cygnoides TaxID=8845 RepID=UPI0034D3805C